MKKYVYETNKTLSDEWFEQLCSEVNNEIKENLDNINLFVCANIALITMYGIPEYTIDHSMDPPYDRSGTLRETGLIEKQEFKNIRFSDFIEMYNGGTTASYCSGCGFFHETYSEDVDSWILDAAFTIQDEIIEKYLLSVRPELENDTDALKDAVFKIRDEIDGDTLAYETYSILPMLRVENENWMLDAIRAEGIFLAKQVEKNRKAYFQKEKELKEKLQKRADAVALKTYTPLSSGKYSGIPYITKNDKDTLRWLRNNYSEEEIELLIIGKKIAVSNALDMEFHSIRSGNQYKPSLEAPLDLEFSAICSL